MAILNFFWKIIKSVFTTILSLILILLLSYAAIFAIGFWVSEQFTDDLVDSRMPIQNDSTMVIKLEGSLIDEPTSIHFPVDFDAFGFEDGSVTSAQEIISALHIAKNDERILNVVIDMTDFYGGGTALMHEVAEAVEDFSTKKQVTSISTFISTNNYIIASASDHIVMDELGSTWIDGYSKYQLYLKESFEKIGIAFNVFTAGDYKSAAENLSRTDMSRHDRESSARWLNDLWFQWLEMVSERRGEHSENISKFASDPAALIIEQSGDPVQVAIQSGLVDKVVDSSDYLALGEDLLEENEISFGSYLAEIKNERMERNYYSDKKNWIALVYGSGVINQGSEGDEGIDPQAFSDLITSLLEEDRSPENRGPASALVIRLNTPGGSVIGSERIRRAIAKVQNRLEIPVVVSFSSVGASGGIWVASQADAIVAHPATITGSIGVVAVLPDFTQLVEKVGANYDGVGTTKYSGFSFVEPIPQSLEDAISANIDHTYKVFKQSVSDKTGLSMEQTEEIAGGQVWTGQQGKLIGLIDELGGKKIAISKAAELANIDEQSYIVYALRPEFNINSLLDLLTQFIVFPSSGEILAELFGTKSSEASSINPYQRWVDEHLFYSRKIGAPTPVIRAECIACMQFNEINSLPLELSKHTL